MKISAPISIDQLSSRMTTDPGALNDVKVGGDKRAQAEVVATQMESIFYQFMLQAMRKTVPESDVMGGNSPAVKQFQSMMDEQLVASGGFSMDPRFHASLVSQIAGDDTIRDGALLGKAGAESQAAEAASNAAKVSEPGL